MSNNLVNFDAIRLTTELNKYQKHKTIPTAFFDGTFTILDIKNLMPMLSKRHQKIADRLIQQYNVDLKHSEEGLYKSFVNEYTAFLKNQHTRNSRWGYPAVLKRYRKNINPVRALVYECREVIHTYNHHNEHHAWIHSLVTDPEFYHSIITDIVKDRTKLDKILNYYLPLYNAGNFRLPFEIQHLRTLRNDLLEYANFFTELRNWQADD
jgi:hypothetical protein